MGRGIKPLFVLLGLLLLCLPQKEYGVKLNKYTIPITLAQSSGVVDAVGSGNRAELIIDSESIN